MMLTWSDISGRKNRPRLRVFEFHFYHLERLWHRPSRTQQVELLCLLLKEVMLLLVPKSLATKTSGLSRGPYVPYIYTPPGLTRYKICQRPQERLATPLAASPDIRYWYKNEDVAASPLMPHILFPLTHTKWSPHHQWVTMTVMTVMIILWSQ